jgi:hypothetical protein
MSSETYPVDPQICCQCRGLCCQGHPGLWTQPQDFFAIWFPQGQPDLSQLSKRLEHEQLTLRDVGDVRIPAPQNTDTGCIFLAADGCQLPPEKRPDQCRALIPDLDTLLDGEIRCSLPPKHGSGQARNNWRTFWENPTGN